MGRRARTHTVFGSNSPTWDTTLWGGQVCFEVLAGILVVHAYQQSTGEHPWTCRRTNLYLQHTKNTGFFIVKECHIKIWRQTDR